MSDIVTCKKFKVNGLEFDVRVAGLDKQGELVVLLHGFPETSLMWCPLMEKLVDKGYRVIAPNQRGYSENARPAGIENYKMATLASDVIELAKQVGFKGKFHLVGHDIGSVVGWTTVTLYPELIKSWTAISVPDWPAYLWALDNDPVQKAKGQYVHDFQTPGLPEKLLAENNYAILKKLWSGFNEHTITSYLDLFSQPKAITSVVNWYRALLQLPQIDYCPVSVPTKLIWGNQDLAIGRAGIEKNKAFVTGPYQFVELDAGHWLMEFNQERVCGEIIANIEK